MKGLDIQGREYMLFSKCLYKALNENQLVYVTRNNSSVLPIISVFQLVFLYSIKHHYQEFL